MKTVIVTGAGGNLGTAVVKLFIERGYRVIATVTGEAGKNVFAPHQSLPVEAVDAADAAGTALFVERMIAQYKQIDAALMLIGGFEMGDVKTTTSDGIKKQISLNFDTAYHVAQPLFQHMMATGKGRLVFIGARPSLQPADGKNMIAYSLSKSLLFRLAEMLNEEAKGTAVTAAVVVPGTLDTAPNRASMPEANPDNWVRPEALAEILEFVVSEQSAPLRETVLKVYNKG